MGAELSNFIKEQYADRPHEARLERMLMHTLSELREQMTKPTRSWRYTKNFFGGEQHHRPVDIVPEEVDKLLEDVHTEDFEAALKYMKAALTEEPTVDRLDVTINNVHYSIPRVTLNYPASEEELDALGKVHLSRKRASLAKQLVRRWAAVMEQIGGDGVDYLLVPASGFAGWVTAHDAIHGRGLTGRY